MSKIFSLNFFLSLFLGKNHLLRYWGCLSPLNWIEAPTLSPLIILTHRKLIRSTWYHSPDVALYIYKYIIHPCMEYFCHVWASGPSFLLGMIEKLQKYVGLLLLYLPPLLNSWLVVEMKPAEVLSIGITLVNVYLITSDTKRDYW